MKLLSKPSLLAAAVAACSTSVFAADNPCRQDISDIEQTMQQENVDQQLTREVEDLIEAAEMQPDGCDVYISRAEELLQQRAGIQVARASDSGTQSGSQQDKTQIKVDQAAADVKVKDDSEQVTVKQRPAQITVEQPPPEVQVSDSEPQVQVDQPKPEVEVDQAEPDVQVTQSEPEVEVEQSEPEVQVVQNDSEAQVKREGQSQQSQSGQTQSQVKVADIPGNSALTQDGEEIGEVQKFVVSVDDQRHYAVIEAGGTLGIGGREIVVPLEQTSATQNGELQTQLTQSDIEQQPAYDEQQYQEVPQSEFAALEVKLGAQ